MNAELPDILSWRKGSSAQPVDWEKLRNDFPILQRQVNGHPLAYLDNAASAQKPWQVKEAEQALYDQYYANVHRGVHTLSQEGTNAFEEARAWVASFINAPEKEEVIFTKGTTDGINLLAYTFGLDYLKPGDEILLTGMEHHANIVPWQLAARRTGAVIKVVPVLDNGTLDLESFDKLLSEKTKLLSMVWVSNSLGTINPVDYMVPKAKALGVPVLLDAAQAAPHMAIDVQALDIDFLVFSAHKVIGPTGFGVLYGKRSWLDRLPPFMGGGDMIDQVRFEETTFNALPHKFEAGTPHISGAIGFCAALKYLAQIGMDRVAAREQELGELCRTKLREAFPKLRFIGEATQRVAVVSFLLGEAHPYDVGFILDKEGVAVRTGHHCCQPLMDRFRVPGTVRASFAFYNTKSEIDQLIAALAKAQKMLLP